MMTPDQYIARVNAENPALAEVLVQYPGMTLGVLRGYKLKTVRVHCIHCCGGARAEADRCVSQWTCPLWWFRTGHNAAPNRLYPGRVTVDQWHAAAGRDSVLQELIKRYPQRAAAILEGSVTLALRFFCLTCTCGQYAEVSRCAEEANCPLWYRRMGRNDAPNSRRGAAQVQVADPFAEDTDSVPVEQPEEEEQAE